jgi:hypothetical protein
MFASIRGHVEVMKLLVDAGADVDATDEVSCGATMCVSQALSLKLYQNMQHFASFACYNVLVLNRTGARRFSEPHRMAVQRR